MLNSKKKHEKYCEKNVKTVYGALRGHTVKTVKYTVKRCGAVRALAIFLSFFFNGTRPPCDAPTVLT